MDVISFVKKHYNINAKAVSKYPNKDVWLIKSSDEIYILKDNQRFDYLLIEEEANKILNRNHIVTHQIIKNTDGYLCTGSFALFTYVPGVYKENFSLDEIESSLSFLAEYNKALAKVKNHDLDKITEYDDAKDYDYLINELPKRIASYQIGEAKKALISKGIQIIKDNQIKIESLPKQIIHADLGSDNFLFYKGFIYSIIDFTPDYDIEDYSLAQYIYWSVYHSQIWNYEKIEIIKDIYYTKSGKKDPNLLYPLLIKAALFRIIPQLNIGNTSLDKRFSFLEFIIKGYDKN